MKASPDGAWCRCAARQKQQDKKLKDVFRFCAPFESNKPFFTGMIKDWLGQKVGDGEVGERKEQVGAKLMFLRSKMEKGEITGPIATTLQSLSEGTALR